jgi:serine/threonine protein kinase
LCYRGIEKTYVAPEMDSSEQRVKKEDLYKGDVWSLGVIMIELCLLEPESMSGDLEVDKLKKTIHANLSQISKKYGKELASILGKLVDIEPRKRPSFKEIQDLLERQYMVKGV